ncbi:MAG: DUF2335 domain-containing protein [bacterium]|nr:DUF2335 domain-containing protein [bacterium]
MQSPQGRPQIVSAQYQGPIPPSSEMANYNLVLPGAAERILLMAELEQGHRHAIERETNQANIDLTKEAQAQQGFGQKCAMILGVGLTMSSVALALMGHNEVAAILGGTTLLGALGLFLKGRGLPEAPSDTAEPKAKK